MTSCTVVGFFVLTHRCRLRMDTNKGDGTSFLVSNVGRLLWQVSDLFRNRLAARENRSSNDVVVLKSPRLSSWTHEPCTSGRACARIWSLRKFLTINCINSNVSSNAGAIHRRFPRRSDASYQAMATMPFCNCVLLVLGCQTLG